VSVAGYATNCHYSVRACVYVHKGDRARDIKTQSERDIRERKTKKRVKKKWTKTEREEQTGREMKE